MHQEMNPELLSQQSSWEISKKQSSTQVQNANTDETPTSSPMFQMKQATIKIILTRDKKEALIRGAQDETQMRDFIITSLPDWLPSLEDSLYGINWAGGPSGSLECLQKEPLVKSAGSCDTSWCSSLDTNRLVYATVEVILQIWNYRFDSMGEECWRLGIPFKLCLCTTSSLTQQSVHCGPDQRRLHELTQQHNYPCEGLKGA